jgi:hypothetical protein
VCMCIANNSTGTGSLTCRALLPCMWGWYQLVPPTWSQGITYLRIDSARRSGGAARVSTHDNRVSCPKRRKKEPTWSLRATTPAPPSDASGSDGTEKETVSDVWKEHSDSLFMTWSQDWCKQQWQGTLKKRLCQTACFMIA